MDLGAYLARIGAGARDPVDELMARHLVAVPFENLSIHLGEPIRLDDASLFDKIVTRRRGGFCYELNGAFALLLEALEYEVTRRSCRVATPGGFTFPGDHMTLAVRVGRRTHRADPRARRGPRHLPHPLRHRPRPRPRGPPPARRRGHAAGLAWSPPPP